MERKRTHSTEESREFKSKAPRPREGFVPHFNQEDAAMEARRSQWDSGSIHGRVVLRGSDQVIAGGT